MERLDKDLLKQRKYLFGTGGYVRSSTGVYTPEDVWNDDDNDNDDDDDDENDDDDDDERW